MKYRRELVRISFVFILVVGLGLLMLAFVNAWNVWMGKLVFEMQLRRSQIYVGEPLVVTFMWRNESKLPLGVEIWKIYTDPLGYYVGLGKERDLEISVLYEDGQRVEGIWAEVDGTVLTQEPLLPGWETQRHVRFGDAYDFSREGYYRLQATYEPWFGEVTMDSRGQVLDHEPGFFERWLAARFRSVREVHVLVLPWDAKALSDARKRAAVGDPGGVRLLGLHNDEESTSLISQCFESENPELRFEAAHALNRIGSTAAMNALGEAAVKELDPDLKYDMVEILVYANSSDVDPWLKAMSEDTVVAHDSLHENGQTVRRYSVRSLISSYFELRGEKIEIVTKEVMDGSEH